MYLVFESCPEMVFLFSVLLLDFQTMIRIKKVGVLCVNQTAFS